MIPLKQDVLWIRTLRSGFGGILISVALAALSYAVPLLDAFGIYISPGRYLLPAIEPLVPSTLIYRLVPEGGAHAGVLLVVTCALLFWTIVFGLLLFVRTSLKRKRRDIRTG